MPFGQATLVLPLLGLLLTRGQRRSVALTATALLAWLNLWWVLSFLNYTQDLPLVLGWLRSPLVMSLGHVVVVVLFLTATGLFGPHRGSPREMALRAAQRGDYVAAGSFWLEAGSPRRAYRAFLRAHEWARAAEAARGSGEVHRAARELQREGGHSLGAAAQLYARLGEETRAQMLWARYGGYLVQSGQSDAAIEPFLRAGDLRRATHAVELALSSRRLAPAAVEAALRAAREAKRPELAAAVAMAVGRFREAGGLFLAAGEYLEAARAFERGGEPMRAAEALRLAGHVDEAARLRAERLASSGQLEQAAEEYAGAGMLGEAAALFARLGRHREAFDHYVRAGALREAAEVARDHGDVREAARLFAEAEEWAEAGAAWERAGDAREAAHCYQQGGASDRALEVLGAAGMLVEQAQLLAELGRVEEGFLVLFQHGENAGAWELLSRYGGSFPTLAEPLVKLAGWLRERGDLTAAISAVQRVLAGRPVERDLLPALLTLAQLLEEHGDLRASEATLQKIVEFDYGFRDAAARLQAVTTRRAAEEAAGARAASGQVPTPPPGEAASRYVLEQELGRGGMGVVYRAFDQRLGRTVAVKVLNPRQHTPEALHRFEREARAAAVLSHPGIVHIYDFDRGFESYFIVMEFVAGPTMSGLLREEPTFVRRNLLPLMRQIADAVAYAHARQVVHRDLKPANMILADRRQIKILDFGIARRLDELDLSASGATGTPYYMAPEQILGEDPDERTDVYSLGVTFFQMATGRLPFVTGNILRAHLEQPPPDPQSLAGDLEPSISHVILRSLAKERTQRYRDGTALAAALAQLTEDEPR